MAITHVLGLPRIGKNREYKKAVEAYWKGESSLQTLSEHGKQIRQENNRHQLESGCELITVGDFAWYDHILQWSVALGVIPERFQALQETLPDTLPSSPYTANLDLEFSLARGAAFQGANIPACDMTKWFNTNYHYIVPELSKHQVFSPKPDYFSKLCEEAKAFGKPIKLSIPGPLSFLYLGKGDYLSGFDDEKLDLLPNLTEAYLQFFKDLSKNSNLEWIQIEEPILALDLPESWRAAFIDTYHNLAATNLKRLVCTYFGGLGENLKLANNLACEGLHLDCIDNRHTQQEILENIHPEKVLSIGIINGGNIWKTNISQAIDFIHPLHEKFRERLWLSSSCSLLHCPLDLTLETRLNAEVKSWLSFTLQKLDELALIKDELNLDPKNKNINPILINHQEHLQSRKKSKLILNEAVLQNTSKIKAKDYQRDSPFPIREKIQQEKFQFPKFPTTTIGSFPQTSTIRKLRNNFKQDKISTSDYHQGLKAEIENVIREQERLDLEVLVHGEAERNDMVEYFGELLEGFAFSDFGWVQSFGSRCVKPPIIFGDISRKQAMTVEWAKYAQSLTTRPVKGMLTGPVTILCWSFVRDDIPLHETCQQIALALREEVADLEKSGIQIIQIDEPALREGLPLRKSDWQTYLNWAVNCFRLSASAVRDETQIHTHMCYAEFNDIIEDIAALDADVITIESSRSNMELLNAFSDFNYPNQIGPGIWDIHSPQVPSKQVMTQLIERAAGKLKPEQLWINPDCGLKTRGWEECREAIKELVATAKAMRLQYD